jgi:hypothetical protein
MSRSRIVVFVLAAGLFSGVAFGVIPSTRVNTLQFSDGSAVGVSPASKARIRYNSGTNQFEQSLNGAAYAAFGGGGGGYATIENNGTPLTARSTLNCDGTLVVCSDDGSETDITLGSTVMKTTASQTMSSGADINLVENGLGTTTGVAMSLQNTTAAANGAQQVSPAFELQGRGYQAGGVNASQVVKTGFDLIPVQGTAFPASVRMAWRTAMGDASYSDALYFDHDENANPQIKNASNLVTGIDFGTTLQLNSSNGIIRHAGDQWPASDFGYDLGEATVRRWKYVWARATYSISQTPAFSSTMNIDCKLGEVVLVTMTGNLGSWTMTNGQAPGQKCTIVWIQDGTGSRTIGTPPSGIKWLPSTYLGTNHVAPTLTTTASARDASYFVWDGTYWLEVNRNFNN